MTQFDMKDYDVFQMFSKQWAIVTAGTTDSYDGCTIGWGSLGTIWNRNTVTVYVQPARYTSSFLMNHDEFTVSFFPEQYRKALGYMGSHSGRSENKALNAGLTSVQMGKTIGFKEANLTFICKKLYQHQLTKEDLDPSIQSLYAASPKVYPDSDGGWQPHYVFVGEILDVKDNR